MKSCPRCNAEYFDNQLEFCLDDGTRLRAGGAAHERTAVLDRPEPAEAFGPNKSQETVVIGPMNDALPAVPQHLAAATSAGLSENAALVLALLHNWWQWIYIEKVYISSIAEFLLSANFLMWLLLLSAGTAVSIYSIKVSKNKTLAIISLVTLAINLILFLVPRR
jgi:hypothetical protein